ncbi:hemolysin XhlA family protein [Neobacillus niacini]|uniref:hemolysin XhlA family protein n=1 Tax=Neobacillus niacini TaxID=86668 RepID=UPI0028563F71|nr:hemolysin XhlA family protein [Neobacillus niacini]MDR7001546.1 hypothetical protein [Neobacillus niacini]
MTEPTNRDWMEIREWLVRIDTKMDMMNEIKVKAEEAKEIAKEAKAKSDENSTKIDGIKKTAMWAIGLTITALISLAAIIVSVAF